MQICDTGQAALHKAMFKCDSQVFTLKNIIIFCRELDKTAGFYSDCIGLKVVF